MVRNDIGVVMTEEKAIKIASKLLKISEEDARNNKISIKELDAFYFGVPVKGGAGLIVANNGEVLYANSSVSYEKHVSAFKEGIRTPLSAFK